MDFDYRKFYRSIIDSSIHIDNDKIVRFIASLLTKPFVILTGLSGSGKTKLAQAFALWICENQNQYCIVPVGADWINREPLLGFPNSLDVKSYLKPDNGILDLIMDASKHENQTKPYFLILDEMNLSHVERYFADFLSVMESQDRKGILLHSDSIRMDSKNQEIPNNIKLPANLFIIGTVNIDETTYMFSPKVLDRANVIEFRVTQKEMKDFFEGHEKINLENLEAVGAPMETSFISFANNKDLKVNTETQKDITETLLKFFHELKKVGAEFGYRSASEILRFGAIVETLETGWEAKQIIDAAIMQKLLPKLHGSRSKLSKVLITLGQLCLEGDKDVKKEFFDKHNEVDFENEPQILYRVSLEKISRMHKNVVEHGFTSYAEA
jgi:5-methylcytosine-specific restriction protein B